MFPLNNNDSNGHQYSNAYLNILIYICLRVCSETPWRKQQQNKFAAATAAFVFFLFT